MRIFLSFLRILPPELAHSIALNSLQLLYRLKLIGIFFSYRFSDAPFTFKGLEFKNKLGIAAGLDKNGDFINSLGALGFGFIEVGTITPKPQPGNSKPRVFRFTNQEAIVNRLGFNNKGVDYLMNNLKNRKSKIIIGTSIGKNHNTPNEFAYRDYLSCLDKVYEFSDYVAVNISSPNTKALRELSDESYLRILLSKIKSKQETLSYSFGHKPIFIKVSPDEELDNLKSICYLIIELQLDGIICSNTTVYHLDANGRGGLSGAPLRRKATDNQLFIKDIVKNNIPIIASGGVMSVEDYQEKIDSGADLVQVYTGFIYEGPQLIDDILNK